MNFLSLSTFVVAVFLFHFISFAFAFDISEKGPMFLSLDCLELIFVS